LATAGNQVYTWDAANSTLRMTRLERRAGSDVVLLKPTYGSGVRRSAAAGGDDGSRWHSVRQLVVNESGTFLALVGSTNISVVRLPEDRGETDPITGAVPCSARRIGNVYNANGIKQVCSMMSVFFAARIGRRPWGRLNRRVSAALLDPPSDPMAPPSLGLLAPAESRLPGGPERRR